MRRSVALTSAFNVRSTLRDFNVVVFATHIVVVYVAVAAAAAAVVFSLMLLLLVMLVLLFV